MNQKNLKWLIELLLKRYGKRNAVHLSSLSKRISFLSLGVRNLQDTIDKKRESEYRYRLANVFARTCAVIGNFPDLDVVAALSQKYPIDGCGYCGKMPCGCDENRSEVKLSKLDPIQHGWRLSEFQEHLKKLYGKANAERGIGDALNLLFSEANELNLLELVLVDHLELNDIYHEYGLELADVIARTIAVANLLGIDLESAVLKVYENGCRTCHNMVCDCGKFKVGLTKFATANSVVE